MHDVAVVGDGPAARALGAALAARGLDAVLVGPDVPWTATYAAWTDDLDGVERWDRDLVRAEAPAEVVTADPAGHVRRRALGRRYGVVDNAALRARLDVAAHVRARVTAITHHPDRARLALDGGGRVDARLAVDATGGLPAFTTIGGRTRTCYQTAYGVILDSRPPEVGGDGGSAVLMDWRPPSPHVAREATFLYVVPLGGGRWLVEETSLARRTPMSGSELRDRLAARFGRDLTDHALDVEHVLIPMVPGVPDRAQATVAFGAAARYVHPATGFSVGASLRAAPRVAAAIGEALGRGADPRALSVAAWNAVWPAEQRRTRALHDIGLGALLRMSPRDLAMFFDVFFSVPTERWAPYLRIDSTPAEVARAMTSVFSAVPWSMRRSLVRGSSAPLHALRR